MRLIKLALAVVAVSSSWAAMANPAIDNSVSASVSGTVGSSAATHLVAGQAQVRLDGRANVQTVLGGGDNHSSGHSSASRSTSTNGMEDSIPRGWLMALVTVLLIGHQLRRKHRFLRPQRFSDL